MLELHIWGPALGLPSIDAECLASLYYLAIVLPKNSWSLIPSNNPSLNPYQKLPALRDGSIWVAGFENIQEHLANRSDNAWNLDSDVNGTQRADCDAFKAFLYSRGFPLLDLSLYVSSENYTSCTRAALGDILTWPQSWTIPHQLRDHAKKRSEHLGLSALDVDVAQDTNTQDAGLTARIPKSLRKSKQTVSSLLGQNMQRTRFRLDAVTENFLEPLNAKLADRDWLITSSPTSADCLGLAIINLMQVPDLPQAWLKEVLSSKYLRLGKWARKQASSLAIETAATSGVAADATFNTALPWGTPEPLSWQQRSILAIEAVVSSVPGLRTGYDRHELPRQNGRPDQKQQVYAKMRHQQRLYSQVVTACIGTTSLLGWMIHAGLLVLPHSRPATPIRRSFGEAGAILGL